MDTFRIKWVSCLLALPIVATAAETGVSVKASGGNVYVIHPNGERKQVTSGGRDYDPSLSRDGKYIVFARETDGPPLPLAAQPRPQKVPRSELWRIDVDGANPELLFAGEIKEGNFRYANFSKPQMSPDDHSVYFLIPYAAVTDAVVRLDLKTSQARLLMPCEQFSIIQEGRYGGFLVIQKRVQEREGIAVSFWLVSPDGEPIRKIADTEAGVKRFIELQNR
jgi:Tol biopolymer transport system component